MPTSASSFPSPTGRGFVPRTVVVTGATSGIGRAAAELLASRVDELVLVGRDPEKLAAVARELGGSGRLARISTRCADLSNVAEVRRLADDLVASAPSVNVLVNNAGAFFRRREQTTEGTERTFALNVLAPFLLTRLLHDRLRASAPARVVMVASAAHAGNHLHLDDLEGARKFSGYAAYGRSKLALILLTHEFARRWKGDGISVNAVHPGFVRTRFGQNNGGGTAAAIRFLSLFALSAPKGAATPVYVATSPQVEGTTGEYFAKSRVVRSSPESYDEAVARALWDVCSVRVGLSP